MKLTANSLDQLRRDLQTRRAALQGEARAVVTMHMGTCGISAGARAVMTALLDGLAERGVTDVRVSTSGCAGLCSREPMATVQLKDAAPVKYVELNPRKIVRILDEHIIGGDIVEGYALAMGSERLA